jgi:hypothetical protein
VSGLLVGLPLVAGPVLLVSHVQHGAQFGEDAARASLLGIVSFCAFAVIFGLLANLGLAPALLIAWFACLGADAALLQLSAMPPWLGLCLAGAAAAAARVLLPHGQRPPTARQQMQWSRWDLPARAATTAGLVAFLTAVSAQIGPTITGVLAPFPVATSVIVSFAMAQEGRDTALAVLHGVLRGIVAFAVFCAAVSLLLRPYGPLWAFGVASAGAFAVQYVIQQRQVRAPDQNETTARVSSLTGNDACRGETDSQD